VGLKIEEKTYQVFQSYSVGLIDRVVTADHAETGTTKFQDVLGPHRYGREEQSGLLLFVYKLLVCQARGRKGECCLFTPSTSACTSRWTICTAHSKQHFSPCPFDSSSLPLNPYLIFLVPPPPTQYCKEKLHTTYLHTIFQEPSRCLYHLPSTPCRRMARRLTCLLRLNSRASRTFSCLEAESGQCLATRLCPCPQSQLRLHSKAYQTFSFGKPKVTGAQRATAMQSFSEVAMIHGRIFVQASIPMRSSVITGTKRKPDAIGRIGKQEFPVATGHRNTMIQETPSPDH